MRRCLTGALWLGMSAVWGAAGCSGESAPPVVVINTPVDERPRPLDASPPTELPLAVETLTAESAQQSPSAREMAAVGQSPAGIEPQAINDHADSRGSPHDVPASVEHSSEIVCG